MENIENIIENLEEELRQELNGEYPFNKNLNQGKNVFTETIYHYTDLSGLIGIIENQCLFASNIGFVNDNKELSYGRDFILKTIPLLKKDLLDYIDDGLINEIIKSVELKSIPEFYTTCFSTENDLLSLWRGYADNGQGIAIGFPIELRSSINKSLKATLVDYNPRKQKSILKETLKISLSFIIDKNYELNLSKDHFNYSVKTIISNILLEYFLNFKDESFKEEQEYRYIIGSPYIKDEEESKVHFRTNGKYLIPYIKLETYADKLLPISEIVIGPSNYRETLKRGIIRILKKNGYDSLPINFSNVPYRN